MASPRAALVSAVCRSIDWVAFRQHPVSGRDQHSKNKGGQSPRDPSLPTILLSAPCAAALKVRLAYWRNKTMLSLPDCLYARTLHFES